MSVELSHDDVFAVHLDYCRYGSRHKKPTTIYTSLFALTVLARRCKGVSIAHVHVEISGGRMASLAGRYPQQLCAAWAKAVRKAAPPHALGARGTVAASFLKDLQDASRRGAAAAISA